MARYTGFGHIEYVLEASDAWRERCFLKDGSLFSDGALWTLGNLQDLKRRLVDDPLEGTGLGFIEKLEKQLGNARPEVAQLAAEVVWFLYLFLLYGPPVVAMKPEKKRQRIERVWGWSDVPLPKSDFLNEQALMGVGHPGQAFIGMPDWELTFFFEVIERWKSFSENQREELIADDEPWRFVEWIDGIEKADTRPMRNVILYFLFPDYLEKIVSKDNRRDIVASFKDRLPPEMWPKDNKPSSCEYDRALLGLRKIFEKEFGTEEIDFYLTPLLEEWSDGGQNWGRALEIMKERHRSFKDIRNAARRAEGKLVEDQGRKTELSADSVVKKIAKEAKATMPQIEAWANHKMKKEEDPKMSEPSVNPPSMHPTANLILYGPPGTGKTYETAWEAVRLCMGDNAAAPLQNDRVALMVEYRRLVDEGRIEFTTFHQSFSYEEFVEGLRPTTESEAADDEQEDTSTSGGFSLKVRDGIFKVISERARLDIGEAVTERLNRELPIYKISLGRRNIQEDSKREALDQNWIHIGHGGDIDWSDDRFEEFSEIAKEWEKQDPEDAGSIRLLQRFRSELLVGDYVVISDGNHRFCAFGKITGEYEFHKDAQFSHRRKVDWLWRDDEGKERAIFYPNQFMMKAIYKLKPELIGWDALETVVIGRDAARPFEGARPHVLIIDEINRANISRVFGELITLLEDDKRLGCENELRVRLPYSGVRFGVPPNLHVVGTMNTADRSIALLDTALRRRFTFRELMPDAVALGKALESKDLNAENLDGINLRKLLDTINDRIEYLFDREHQIGHAYFIDCKSRDDVEEAMRHKIIPLLAEYFYEDWVKVAAVLGDKAGGSNPHFLEAEKLSRPDGLSETHGEEDPDDIKWRWRIREKFDFSEFAA